MRVSLSVALVFAIGFLMLPGQSSHASVSMSRDVPVRSSVSSGQKDGQVVAGHNWRHQIDAYWGPGVSTPEKLRIFDLFWKTINRRFACFQGIDIDWREKRDRYRAEIANGVSAGRFAAIMNHLARSLRETHTLVIDQAVNIDTSLEPGVPLLAASGWGEAGHFGAALTPLPDFSLLVYSVVPDHPLGLEVGDIVLGYDGVPWRKLYRRLVKAELPLAVELPLGIPYLGSSKSSYEHSWLNSAGMNWHLFDTIDVMKHETGEVVHLSTAPLSGKHMQLWASEQLPVPGVPFPVFDLEEFKGFVSHGVIEGTRIGYIYVWAWVGTARSEFRDAVAALADTTDGLIIDYRLNFGGGISHSNGGYELLFPERVTTIAFAKRAESGGHLAMVPEPGSPPSAYVIPSNGIGYDHPIAVLVGPGCVSAGDHNALRLKFHPRARFFGKSTATAFNSPVVLSLENSDWYAQYAAFDSYLVSDPANYLTHDEFQVDDPVWHTQEAVINGRDAVVDRAVDWINQQTP